MSFRKQLSLSLEDETRRIIAAGGWVEFNRVNGMYKCIGWIKMEEIVMHS